MDMTVPDRPRLLKIRDIQHLYTPVEGQLNQDATILQLTKSLHPTPALGGVPRTEALAAIRKYEPMNRGLYAAPIGWLDAEGNGEFAVAIRSAALLSDKAYLYAGGGIVADSEPQSEYEETLVKFRPMLRALGDNCMSERKILTDYVYKMVASLVQAGVENVVVSPAHVQHRLLMRLLPLNR